MKNYLICAGGSGVRALEAALHLCAAGLGPEEVKVLVIDPDGANGNYARTNAVFANYQGCSKAYGNNLGGERFFRSTLTSLGGGNAGGVCAWSPVNTDQQFRDVLGFGNMTLRQREVARLLFTDAELSMKLDIGFKGHPALGAAALALLPLYGKDPVWDAVNSALTKDVETGQVRVVIAGSVFGGTGASVFFPLARRLREMAGGRQDNLRIGAVALAPYFTFPVSDDPTAAADRPDARKFALATRAAAQFYAHLRRRRTWDFDAMFWLGDDNPSEVSREDGGQYQKNSAHFIDLLAGLTCLDYFRRQEATSLHGLCYYAGPDDKKDNASATQNVTGWNDLPLIALERGEIKKQLLLFGLAGAMHVGFFRGLFEDSQSKLPRRPTAIPWYYERFERNNIRLNAAPHNDHMKWLSDFFLLHHFPWWREVHASAKGRVQLLNEHAFLHQPGPPEVASFDLRKLANFLYPDVGNLDQDAVHRFFNYTFTPLEPEKGQNAPVVGAPAYLATLGLAARVFTSKEYREYRKN